MRSVVFIVREVIGRLILSGKDRTIDLTIRKS